MHTELEKTPITDFLTNFNTNVSSNERMASALGGGLLVALGLKQGGVVGALLTLVGGGLALRGATGHCQVYDALEINTSEESDHPRSQYHKGFLDEKVHVTKSVTINKSPAEIYAFWHSLENLPQFMSHLESVTKYGDKRSHWVAKAPLGTTVEWDAEITSEIENERIGWKSVAGSEIVNSGVVEFKPTQDRGTEVRVTLTYEPPAGKVGAIIAKIFSEEPNKQVADDLRRFKSLMEARMIMTTEGQSSGRKAKAKKASA